MDKCSGCGNTSAHSSKQCVTCRFLSSTPEEVAERYRRITRTKESLLRSRQAYYQRAKEQQQ